MKQKKVFFKNVTICVRLLYGKTELEEISNLIIQTFLDYFIWKEIRLLEEKLLKYTCNYTV